MLRVFLLVATALAILVCSINTPVSAHAIERSVAEAVALNIDGYDAQITADEIDRSATNHPISYHCHGELGACHGEMCARIDGIGIVPLAKSPLPYPQVLVALRSRAEAPLTEPPAA